MDSAHIWSQRVARRALMGYERTNNPTPAAAAMLGTRAVQRAKAKLKRRGRKRAHKGNPLPAVVGLLGGSGLLGKLGGRFRTPSEVRAAKVAPALVAAANAGNLTAAAGLIERAAQVARASTRRSRRQRYPTYTDRYGRQRYSYKPPGSQLRLPAGATPSADTAYSFFRGAVGRGGVGTTAAQLGVAAAAGAAAYFGTQAILKYFGGRAVRQEEAGVQLALAARDARKEYALAHNLRGAPPTYGVPASVIREIGAGMKQQLAELGYNAQGVRTRSGVENFLSTYAPEEE